MIVVMKQGATDNEITHMIRRVEELGLKAHPIYGTERTVIAAIGEKRGPVKESLESGPGVSEVVPILAPYKVASLEVKPERTVVRAGPFSVGNGHLGVSDQCTALASGHRTAQQNLHTPRRST